MPGTIRPLIAGNWKMNGLQGSSAELDAILKSRGAGQGNADLLICPPATLVAAFAARAKGSQLAIGGQDCHTEASGAHTSDITAEKQTEAKATNNNERQTEHRAKQHETDGLVRSKAEAAWRAG